MPLNKQTGNMYPWVTHTWNPIQGRCPNWCIYCYMHRLWKMAGDPPQALKEEYLNDDLGSGNIIFVGSSTDMWMGETAWIKRVLNHCRAFLYNTYLFQSKNPFKMIGWIFPIDTILGTTIETNRNDYGLSCAPVPAERAVGLAYLKKYQGMRTMVSIEPIVEFDLREFVYLIKLCEPEFVSIGANSNKSVKLPEPSSFEVAMLIEGLEKFTEVRVKDNLGRITES